MHECEEEMCLVEIDEGNDKKKKIKIAKATHPTINGTLSETTKEFGISLNLITSYSCSGNLRENLFSLVQKWLSSALLNE
jgi:hypothetical protein